MSGCVSPEMQTVGQQSDPVPACQAFCGKRSAAAEVHMVVSDVRHLESRVALLVLLQALDVAVHVPRIRPLFVQSEQERIVLVGLRTVGAPVQDRCVELDLCFLRRAKAVVLHLLFEPSFPLLMVPLVETPGILAR